MGVTGGTGQAPADEHAGFRDLLEDLLAANLRRCPQRASLIRRREAAVLIATDAGLAVTVRMLPAADVPGSVSVRDGEDPEAAIAVRAESLALLELAGTPLRFGLPDPLTADGRDVLLQIARRRIRVRGMVRHLGTVRRLSILLSAR